MEKPWHNPIPRTWTPGRYPLALLHRSRRLCRGPLGGRSGWPCGHEEEAGGAPSGRTGCARARRL
jgi:hypothetical protein